MARFVTRRRRLLTSERADRASRRRVRKGTWVDPFAMIHGTLPEKMVYAELSRRQIPFLFLNDIRFQIPEIAFDKHYQADFVLPAHKIIIEVQGAYWHSTEEAIESDAFKFAIYQITGYTVLAWWDYEIYADIQGLFNKNPILAGHPPRDVHDKGSSELPVKRRTKVDTSKGIRTMNMRRAMRHAYKKPTVRRKIKR